MLLKWMIAERIYEIVWKHILWICVNFCVFTVWVYKIIFAVRIESFDAKIPKLMIWFGIILDVVSWLERMFGGALTWTTIELDYY